MKSKFKIFLCSLACVSMTALAGVATADEAADKAIKARKALMQLYAFNLGGLGAMAKGAVAYDETAAKGFADNLLALAKVDQSAMWPPGSDTETLGDKTAALKAAWDTYPAVVEKQKAMIAGAEKMAASAGGGVDGIKASMGAVGGSCKGCHDDFRKPK